MTTGIQEFFRRYEQVFGEGAARGRDELYADCFVAASPAGVTCGANDETFATVVAQGVAFYRRLGMQEMRVLSVEERWLGPSNCMATVHWRATFTTTDPMEFDVSYLLHVGDDGPRVFGWVSHEDEQEAFRSRGLVPVDEP